MGVCRDAEGGPEQTLGMPPARLEGGEPAKGAGKGPPKVRRGRQAGWSPDGGGGVGVPAGSCRPLSGSLRSWDQSEEGPFEWLRGAYVTLT